jgi:hypothetical protein
MAVEVNDAPGTSQAGANEYEATAVPMKGERIGEESERRVVAAPRGPVSLSPPGDTGVRALGRWPVSRTAGYAQRVM